MTIPPYLKPGDSVAIVAPAGFIEPGQVSFAIRFLESWKLKIIPGKNIYSKYFNFSGTDIERISDLQEAIDNPDIRAIFCIRGGYGLIRIIDKIDWINFIKFPKWIIGYSDVTVLHAYLNNVLNIASIHGPMLINFEKLSKEKKSLDYLKQLLFGNTIKYSLSNKSTTPVNINGVLRGGNLSLLFSLRGTSYDFEPENTILFLEDIGEYHYHIDRIIQNFRLGNKFKGLKGILLGGFTDLKENEIPFGFSINEIVKQAVNNVPVIDHFPAGHMEPNYPLALGKTIEIKSVNNLVEISQG